MNRCSPATAACVVLAIWLVVIWLALALAAVAVGSLYILYKIVMFRGG